MKTIWNKRSQVAQFGGANQGATWANEIQRLAGMSLDEVKMAAEANPSVSFFFYCRDGIYLDNYDKGEFSPGDAVLFSGAPWYGSAPQCDTYVVERIPRNILWMSEMPQITGGSANPNALRVNGTDDRDLKNLLDSVYTHVIVCSFHFRNNTDFTPLYNGFSAAEYRAPWRDFQFLKQGENYKTLMISLGGWNNECWKHMQGKEDEAARKLAEFVDAHGFDGIDLNFEGDGYGNNHDAHRAAMGKCAESLRDHLGDRIITISPIFGDEAAKQLGEIKNAREVISWVNVQLYYYQNYNNTTGGHHNSPMDYSDAVTKTGFPASRVVAGFALNGAQPENDVTDAGNTQRAQMNAAELANCEGYVRAMVRNNSDFGGVFLWRYLKTMQPQQPDGKMLRWDSAMKAAMQPQGQIV